jgi:DDE domain
MWRLASGVVVAANSKHCLSVVLTRARSLNVGSAALAFMKKALKRNGQPHMIVTDGLRSYPAAMRDLGNLHRREMGRWFNNRAENSHLPFRRRERAMLRFRAMKSLQRFASVHANVHNHFNLERHLVDRPDLQTTPLGRLGRVTIPRWLGSRPARDSPVHQRPVRIRLTAPRAPFAAFRIGLIAAFGGQKGSS